MKPSDLLACLTKYDPDQPRVPAGHGRESGRFGDSESFPSAPIAEASFDHGLNTSSDATSARPSITLVTTCSQYIAENYQGRILRDFPSQFLDTSLDDLLAAAQGGDAAARRRKSFCLTNASKNHDVERPTMSSALFRTIKLLEAHHIHFTIERTRPDTIRVNATLVGERLEIEIFEDDHVELSHFRGSEDIEGGFPELEAVVSQDSAPL